MIKTQLLDKIKNIPYLNTGTRLEYSKEVTNLSCFPCKACFWAHETCNPHFSQNALSLRYTLCEPKVKFPYFSMLQLAKWQGEDFRKP